ncbi:hypothetical protein BV898_19266 [Hypsibius exemplaris]|uniref:Uncharacterized protein n=1 Tax=Hypsibius exemplaris TaxID=2072580 RepID=A0A9X6RNS3_HYPEX|nr:hypothetical protein BV898_19266 [Hypsibius exemplaris]
MSRVLSFLVVALISGVCLAQKEDQQPGSCTCRARPPPGPAKDEVGTVDDDDDEPPMMRDDEDAPPPRHPPPPHRPPHEREKSPQGATKLGERPCEKKREKKPIPHCLNNGTTVNMDRPELDTMLKASPTSEHFITNVHNIYACIFAVIISYHYVRSRLAVSRSLSVRVEMPAAATWLTPPKS